MQAQALEQRLQATGRLWRDLSPGYKRLLLGLLAAATFSGALAYYLNRPEWVILGQFPAKEAGNVTAKLTSLKVPYQPAPDGQTIQVNKADLFTARLAVAQAGINQDGVTGYELFDNPRFGATDLEQRVNLQRALEGELTRALLHLGQVHQVSVRLAIPEPSAFVRNQQPPTAAVLLQLEPGAELSGPVVQGLMRFVASSVPGLTPEGVTVLDDHGRLLSDTAGLGDLGSITAQSQQRLDLEKNLEHRVLGLLEPAFGVGNVVTKVSLELDTAKRTTDTHTFVPAPDGQGLVRSQETTHETSSGGSTAGATPTPSPAPGTTAPQYLSGTTAPESTADKTHTVTNYDYGEQHQVEVTTPGGVRRVTAGIIINAASGLSTDEVNQVRQTVAASLGATPTDITVSTLPFRQPSALQTLLNQPPVRPSGVPRWLPYGGSAALLILGLLMWLALRRRQVTRPAQAWPELAPPALPAGAPADSALTVAAPESAVQATAGRGAPGNGDSGRVAPDDAAAAEQAEGMDLDPERAEALFASLLGADSPVLANPKVRENIERAVHRRPQDAAAILSTWIHERKR